MVRFFRKRTRYSRRKISKKTVRSIVKRQLNRTAEKKFYDQAYFTSFLLGDPSNPLLLSLLNGLLIGTSADATHRVGNKIFVKGVYLNVTMSGPATGGPPNQGCMCRILVVNNKEGGKAMVSLAELFTSAGSNAFSSTRNSIYLHKYRMLCDRMHSITATSMNGTDKMSGPMSMAQIYIPINKAYDFAASNDSAGTSPYGPSSVAIRNVDTNFGNLLKDDIQLAVYSSANATCLVNFNWKVVFTDS